MRYIRMALAALASRAREMPLSGRALQACAAFGVLMAAATLRQHTLALFARAHKGDLDITATVRRFQASLLLR